jgi:hypothetical protein
MRILCALATAAIVVSAIAMAQETARDITREMGADTTTSVSQGLDRYDIHQDTETVRQAQRHAPSLLDSAQGEPPKPKRASKSEKKLQRQRDLLLKDRRTTIEKAGKKAKEANEKTRPSFLATSQVSVDEAKTKAASEWDARWGKKVQAIERALKEESQGGTEARFHGPSLINPK